MRNIMGIEAAEQAASAAGAAAAGALGLKTWVYGGLLGAGIIGAVVIAAVDPAEAQPDPKKRRKLIFAQGVTAATVALVFGARLTSWLCKPGGWLEVEVTVDLAAYALAYLEVALPVGFTLGALSWGIIGALVKLRQIIRERGGEAVARKAGIDPLEDQHAGTP